MKKIWIVILVALAVTEVVYSQCSIDTINTDVIMMIDNSASIDNSEFSSFGGIILATVNEIDNNCPDSRRGIVHYGGAFGQSVTVEHQLSSSNPINTITRQFCTNATCNDGGDDLNYAMGEIIRMINTGELQRDSNNNLEIVVFTDAFSESFCNSPNCSITLPTTNVDSLKREYGASVTVVGISDQARPEFLGITASVGGTYQGSLNNACASSFEGCTLPRQYIPVEFTDNPLTVGSAVAGLVSCATQIISPAAVDAGVDQSFCGDRGESATLTASAIAGQAPFTFDWSNNLGSGASVVAAPATNTTFTVTITDDNGCIGTDQVFVEVLTCGPDCSNDTISNDIIFMIDNSASIDNVEFSEFENIILGSLAGVGTQCPLSRCALVHYGGAFGQGAVIEYDLNFGHNINGVNRQFCVNASCNDGGDDLNLAMGQVLQFIQDGSLNRNPNNELSIVVFTDAFNEDTCGNPNCSVSLPTTNVDILKSNFGADVTVVGISDQAASEALSLSASIGGTFNGDLDAECSNTLDGCTLPRKYIQIEFSTDPTIVADQLTADLVCDIQIVAPVMIDLGPDQTICGNLNETASINTIVLNGTEPISYQWDNNQGSFQNIIVRPLVSTTYHVTATDANMCMTVDSVTITPITCNTCFAEAGNPQEHKELCLDNGRATITIDINGNLNVPQGFEELYLLTDENLTILNYNVGRRAFTVSEPGLYRVHTLIAEVNRRNSPDFLDLSIIQRGISNLFIVGNCIIDHGVCANLDYAGRVHIVLPPSDMMCMTFENSINLCSDGIDNDGDGLVDCVDDDCKPLINCLENTLIACNDLYDNDLDGLVDCNDPDCYEFIRCFERGEQCKDGKDNDGDGLIDCDDDSCFASGECMEDTPFTCKDGLDNDNDGLTDCAEASCQAFIVCREWGPEACEDGIDNDIDGLVDCADADCRNSHSTVCAATESTTAFCTDGLDNDADGLVDCNDPDCEVTTITQNFIRQDIEVIHSTCPTNNNGSIAFNLASGTWEYSIDGGENFQSANIFASLEPGDYILAIQSATQCIVDGGSVTIDGEGCPEICDNGIDDDGDGQTDCNDSECGIIEALPAQVIDPICPTLNNGMIRLFYINGGSVAGIEYSINSGNTFSDNPVFRNLDPGTYQVVARTVNGCTASTTVTLQSTICAEVCDNGLDDDGDGDIDCADSDCGIAITQNDVFITNPSNCRELDDGAITITLSNPNGVDYKLGDGDFQSQAIFEDLEPRSFLITVRNESGCSDTLTVSLQQIACSEICNNGLDDDGDGMVDCEDGECNEGLGVELSASAATCPDNNNGSIQITGGITGATYSIDGQNFQTSTLFDGLVPEDYIITVRNTEGCETDIFTTIEGTVCNEICNNGIDDDEDGMIDCEDGDCNDGLGVTITTLAAMCPQNNDGIIQFETNYVGQEYSIDGFEFFTEPTIGNLTPDNYTVTVRNANGCMEVQEIQVAGSICDEICNNDLDDDGDGMIDCADGDCIVGLDASLVITNASCPDNNNGTITVETSTPNLSWSIDNENFQSTPFENLDSGYYAVIVTNQNGCRIELGALVRGEDCSIVCESDMDGDGVCDADDICNGFDDRIELNLDIEIVAPICNNQFGVLEILNFDPNVEYTLLPLSNIESSGNIAFSSEGLLENVNSGNYQLMAVGYCDSLFLLIEMPTTSVSCDRICEENILSQIDTVLLQSCFNKNDFNIVSEKSSCLGADGRIEVISTGSQLEFSLDNSDFQESGTFENLSPGGYTLKVRDSNNCQIETSVLVEGDMCLNNCSEQTSLYDDLMAFYLLAGGPNWINNTGWAEGYNGDSCDPCSFNGGTWFGVDCEGDNVVAINLRANELTGIISNTITNLIGLEVLRLDRNQLFGEIPSTIGTLGDLTDLALYENNLTGQIPIGISQLSKLRNFALQGNELSGSIPPELGNLNNLTGAFQLHNNNLIGPIPPELGNLSSQNLTLGGNNLEGEIPEELFNNLNLERVDFYNNNLSGPIPLSIATLPNLRWALFQNNQLSGCFEDELLALCSMGQSPNTSSPGYNFLGNNLLPWEGDLSRFCNGEGLTGATCDDGNLFTVSDTISSNCDCVGVDIEVCNNNIDDDLDGFVDFDDPDCLNLSDCPQDSCAFVPMRVLINGTSCPDKTDGAIAISDGLDGYTYGLSGSAFQLSNVFEGLGNGTLEIVVKNLTGCDTIFIEEMTSESDCNFLPAFGGVALDMRVYLEGAYQTSSGQLNTGLNNFGYLPGQDPKTFFGLRTDPGQPYTGAPWFYSGSEHEALVDQESRITTLYDETVVDWILLSLRAGVAKETELYRTAALLYNDGTVQLLQAIPEYFDGSEFYIVIEHRNHLPIMSPTQIPIVQGVLTYDFTKSDSYTSVIGTGQKLKDSKYMMAAGNGEMTTTLSSDVDINIRDLTAWLFLNGSNSGYYDEDYDMNGDVNIKDRILWEKNNGLFSSVITK